MTGYIWELLIIAFLIAIVIWAIRKISKKAKKGGGCCGEHEAAEKSLGISDKDRSHYPYAIDLKISGMHCSNCAKKVENALNALDGTWASVNKSSNTAHILLKEKADIKLLCATIAKAGYMANPL